MDTQSQKRIMHACFMYMMANEMLSSDNTLFRALKSIIYILENTHHLSQLEQDNCLIYFFNDYSLGCSSPMPEPYVRSTIIPAIRNYDIIDISLGELILAIALDM